jgi:hypothetical protein
LIGCAKRLAEDQEVAAEIKGDLLLSIVDILDAHREPDGLRVVADMAATVLRTTLGAKHPLTLAALMKLAAMNRDDNNLTLARELEEEVLAIRSELYGRDHPITLEVMHSLANTTARMGDWNAADAYSGPR